MNFNQKLNEFSGKNVLLLQGPVGNFFYKLSNALKKKKKQKYLSLILTEAIKFFIPFKLINIPAN